MLCKDPRTLAAGGGVEMEIAQQLGEMARKETGLEQYAIGKFAEALEVRWLLYSLCLICIRNRLHDKQLPFEQ